MSWTPNPQLWDPQDGHSSFDKKETWACTLAAYSPHAMGGDPHQMLPSCPELPGLQNCELFKFSQPQILCYSKRKQTKTISQTGISSPSILVFSFFKALWHPQILVHIQECISNEELYLPARFSIQGPFRNVTTGTVQSVKLAYKLSEAPWPLSMPSVQHNRVFILVQRFTIVHTVCLQRVDSLV